VEKWLEREIGVKVNVKEAFKINKDKRMLAKIVSWEQKKNIMLSESKLKKKKVRGCIQADSRSQFIRNFLISQNHINMKIGS
jgi:hypothetical protein